MRKIKIGLGILIIISVLASSGVVVARTSTPDTKGKEKIVFIHYKNDFVRRPSGRPGKAPTCYGFLSKGAKLKTTEDLIIAPNLDISAILASAEEWDSHTTSVNLFGGYTIDSTANWDGWAGSIPDGRNEFSYGNYPQSGVIAVTVVWGYFSGPASARYISEFDVLFDTDYEWGDADPNNDGVVDNPNVMDLQNIATHEIGHGVGLADVYQTACSEVTMYGYSDYGEIIKRTLETPDITGLQKLYGQ